MTIPYLPLLPGGGGTPPSLYPAGPIHALPAVAAPPDVLPRRPVPSPKMLWEHLGLGPDEVPGADVSAVRRAPQLPVDRSVPPPDTLTIDKVITGITGMVRNRGTVGERVGNAASWAMLRAPGLSEEAATLRAVPEVEETASAADKILLHLGGATLDPATLTPTTKAAYWVANPRLTRTIKPDEDFKGALTEWLKKPDVQQA